MACNSELTVVPNDAGGVGGKLSFIRLRPNNQSHVVFNNTTFCYGIFTYVVTHTSLRRLVFCHSEDLVLDGEAEALTLLSIQLDGRDLVEGVDYALEGDALTVPAELLGKGTSKLTTQVEIWSEGNTQLSGLYKSGSMYCTQCEATG